MVLTTSAMLLFAAVTSTASSGETVRLRLGDCVPSRDLVHDFIAIEIGFERLVETNAALDVIVECEEPEVLIRLEPNVLRIKDRRIAAKEVKLRNGARLVALNIAELLQELELERRREVPRAIVVSTVATTTTNREPTQSPSLRARLGAAPTVRVLPGPKLWALGARASFGLDAALDAELPWSVQLSAGFEQSLPADAADAELGTISTRGASASIAVGTRLELGSSFALFGLLEMCGGWVWIEGRTSSPGTIDARSGDGGWFGPAIGARLRYGERIGVTFGVEGGWTSRGVHSEGLGLRDGWIGADLTLDWSVGG